MAKSAISFFWEDIDYTLKQKGTIRKWITDTIKNEGFKAGNLSIIFCSDEYLLKINIQYLNHNTFTDIITFDNSEDKAMIEGDIFISIDRIRENAASLSINENEELNRVIIHGVLHLCGYTDKSSKDKKTMTGKEDFYLARLTAAKKG